MRPMSLYGPLPAQNFLRLLKRIGESTPDRKVCEEILDGIIDAIGAERGFLYRIRPGGGFMDMDEAAKLRKESGAAMYGFFGEVIDERTTNPGDDIISRPAVSGG